MTLADLAGRALPTLTPPQRAHLCRRLGLRDAAAEVPEAALTAALLTEWFMHLGVLSDLAADLAVQWCEASGLAAATLVVFADARFVWLDPGPAAVYDAATGEPLAALPRPAVTYHVCDLAALRDRAGRLTGRDQDGPGNDDGPARGAPPPGGVG